MLTPQLSVVSHDAHCRLRRGQVLRSRNSLSRRECFLPCPSCRPTRRVDMVAPCTRVHRARWYRGGVTPRCSSRRPRRSSTRRRYPRRRHRAPIPPRLGRRQQDQRRQAAHRRGCEGPTARRRWHRRRLDPRPRRRTLTAGRTARQFLHHRAGLGRWRLPRTVAHLGERRSHPCCADHQTHPPGGIGFHVRAMITTMTRRLARTLTVFNTL
jgi:hypothetical protein